MDKYERKISEIFATFLDEHTKVILFGSRATGHFHATSDYDFAIKAEHGFSSQKLNQLKQAFHESTIPFKIDVVNLDEISPVFYNEIIKKGIEWKLHN